MKKWYCSLLLLVALVAFAAAPALADVTLPIGMTEVETQAFLNNAALTGTLVIPEGTTKIGAEAFMNCMGLTAVQFPEGSAIAIGSKAFAGCTGLDGSTVILGTGSTMAEDAFDGCNVTVVYGTVPAEEYFTYTISDDNEVTITGFNESCGITEVIIPDTLGGNKVTCIGDSAFALCSKLTNIIIPDGVTYIDNQAFFYCVKLVSITIPNSVTSIGAEAFKICTGLTEVQFSAKKAITIGKEAFAYCTGLNGTPLPYTRTAAWRRTPLMGVM